jgi:transcriptional regulator with XRE-family HTH domain
MKFLEKIAFIEKQLHLSDFAFCSRFRIKISVLKKWRKAHLAPTPKDVVWLCNYFNLDVNDFLDDSSTLAKEPKEGEHPCATKPHVEKKNEIYEDYAREDNPRYEEKD